MNAYQRMALRGAQSALLDAKDWINNEHGECDGCGKLECEASYRLFTIDSALRDIANVWKALGVSA